MFYSYLRLKQKKHNRYYNLVEAVEIIVFGKFSFVSYNQQN